MAIELKQFAGHTVTAQDDAIINDLMFAGSGIIKGCEISFVSVNVVNISQGWGVVKGRLFKVTETTLNCKIPTEDGVGIIKIRMDLSNSSMPIEITSVAVAGDVYPAVNQDEDCNFNNGIYEIELAKYSATAAAITELEATFARIKNLRYDVLNTVEEIEANTNPNRLAGALALKEALSRLNTETIRYNPDTDMVQLLDSEGIWRDWRIGGLSWDGFIFNAGNEYTDRTGGFYGTMLSHNYTYNGQKTLYSWVQASPGMLQTTLSIDPGKYNAVEISYSNQSNASTENSYWGLWNENNVLISSYAFSAQGVGDNKVARMMIKNNVNRVYVGARINQGSMSMTSIIYIKSIRFIKV